MVVGLTGGYVAVEVYIMAYFAALPTSFMRDDKKCFKNSKKDEIQNFFKKGGATEKNGMVPMDRVELPQGCQPLSSPGTNLINTRRMKG